MSLPYPLWETVSNGTRLSVDHHRETMSYNNNNADQLENGIQLSHQPNKYPLIVKYWLLAVNVVCTAIGAIGGPLLVRLYFNNGGTRKWIPGWLQTAGFPLQLIPILIVHSRNRNQPMLVTSPKLLICGAAVGVFTGLDNYMYSLGLSYLPVSTSVLLLATQLAFTAFFSFIITRHKFTPYSINAVVLMTLGAVMLGIRNNGDRPVGVDNGEYMLGFIRTIGAAGLLGFVLPCTEVIYAKAVEDITYSTVMQFQFCTAMFATIFCSIGSIINKDFQAIPKEAHAFRLGVTKYYLLLGSAIVVWQLMFVGIMGTIFCASSLFAGVINATIILITQVAGVVVFKEKFTAEKGMALVLSLWGFTSYFYGSYKENKKLEKTPKEQEVELK